MSPPAGCAGSVVGVGTVRRVLVLADHDLELHAVLVSAVDHFTPPLGGIVELSSESFTRWRSSQQRQVG
jgi:hypothetical protein